MSKSTATAPVVAGTVRAYFRAESARMDRLSPEAQATVKDGARGRLHPQAIKVFNAKRKADRRYVLGATKVATATRKDQRATLRAQGLAGERGPLSKAAKAVLAQPKG